jgi:hypothetical protein
MAASLRLHVAEPRAATIETVDGERLHRYTFRVESPRDHEDAVIARMYDHLRHHQATQVSFEVWLSDNGDLRRTRGRAKVYEQAQGYTLRAFTTDYWDFGVTTEISAPSPDQILRLSEGSANE